MLVPRLINMFRFAQTTKTTETALTTPTGNNEPGVKDPFRRKKKDGPELEIAKILIIHGPLNSK